MADCFRSHAVFLCPYSEYERQNILNFFLSYRHLICDFLWYDDIAGALPARLINMLFLRRKRIRQHHLRVYDM